MIREEDMREAAGAVELDDGAEAEARRLLTAAFETAPARPGLAAAWGTPGKTAAPASDPLGRVRKRAARERRRRVLVPAGAVALAAAVAGGLTTGVVTAGGGAAAPSARTALTAALVKTSAQSFTFTASASRRLGPTTSHGSVAGEFDPVRGAGKEQVRSGGDQWQIRYTGAHAYSTTAGFAASLGTHGKPWAEFPAVVDPAEVAREGVTGFLAGMPINPAGLLTLLKSAATVRAAGPASGPGWTGTKYTFTLPPDSDQVPQKASGTVSVDSAGRVRQLVARDSTVASVLHGNTVKKEVWAVSQTLTFGGFGTPVTVTAPPADQVFNAGNNKFLLIQPGVRPGWAGWVTH
jgi:hypothetical protein